MKMSQRTIVSCLFFFSGFSSLIYESIWIRVLSLGVGSTSAAISMVLGIFFLGMSLGSWLSGRFSYRIKNPLWMYGIIEGIIGLYSFFLLFVLYDFHKLLGFFPLSGSFSILGVILKFLSVLLLILLPSTLMGASLPLLIKHFVKTKSEIGRKISFLYGLNTLGAVAGAFVTGFYLIPILGTTWANHFSVFVNLVILLVAFFIAKTNNAPLLAEESKSENQNNIQKSKSKSYTYLIYLSAGLVGFSALAAEVVWNKYLGIFLGSNIYGLSLVLCVFLLGLGLGAIVLSQFIDKIKNKFSFYLWLLIAASFSIVLSSYLLSFSPLLANIFYYYFGFACSFFFAKATVCFLILLPSSSFLGMLLPLAIDLVVTNPEDSAKESGQIYASNTIGSILGSCLTGLVLIPWLGSSNSIKLACLVLVFLPIPFLFQMKKNQIQTSKLLFSALGFVLVLVVFIRAISFEQIIHFAYEQKSRNYNSLSELFKRYLSVDEEFKLIYEGQSGIITLSHDPTDGERYRNYYRLKTNGLNESIYDRKDQMSLPKYEALLGFLPIALGRDPKSAFIVGYGGGYTVNFLSSTNLKKVYVAELEKGILEASKFVYDGELPYKDRKNLEIRIEDARFVLATKQGGPYDIIVSQPSHSWLAGVANLFTEEFFTIVSNNLTDEGVFSQWLNLYNMDARVLSSILKTFYTVFPHGMVFTGTGDQELIMIGSKKEVRFDLMKLHSLISNREYAQFLSGVPIANIYQAMSLFVLTREDVLHFAEDAKINTDRNAYAEVLQSKLFYEAKQETPNQFLLKKFQGNYSSVIKNFHESSAFYDGILRSMPNDFYKYQTILAKLENLDDKTHKKDPSTAFHLLQMERYATALKEAEQTYDVLKDAESIEYQIVALRQMNRLQDAVSLAKKFKSKLRPTSDCYLLEVYAKAYDWPEADRIAKKLLSDTAFFQSCGPLIQKGLGFYFWYRGDYVSAIPYLETYYSQYPRDLENYRALTALYLLNGQVSTGLEYAKYLESVVQAESSRLTTLIDYYKSNGFDADAEVLNTKLSRLINTK
ncbi:MAG: fused MFS/spermidine synthase [Oligoflexia bacterium]|nr:fused MFS/spermidine synthase [Oligoflexia bacterium]